MQQLLADCDVYLATTCENHSIQVLEAMALGKPILGYAHGGTTETVPDGCGRLVPAGDMQALNLALPVVYQNRRTLGAQAREHVAQFYTWDRLIGGLAEVYGMAQAQQAQTHAPQAIKCSIVIPLYNKAAYIGETIASALGQIDAPNYEVIVVNDGSTDSSLGEAHFVADKDKRVRIFDRPNAGVSAARNFGITQARGEYICCLDADDKIDPLFLARLAPALDSDPGLGIAYSDFISFGINEQKQPWEAYITCSEYDFAQLRKGNFLPCCNLFRKVAWERAGGYKPINPSWEDYELWLNMGKLGWYGRRIPQGLFRYRKVIAQGRDHESQGHAWQLRGIVNRYHRDLYAPTVSFIVPCYQQSQFLADALDSIVAQTFPDWEVVVVDDGNAPAEAEAIAAIAAKYPDDAVRVLRLAENSGLATARNSGVAVARGSWLVMLDADDKIAPTYLEQTFRATELNPRKFAYTDSQLWWPAENDRLAASGRPRLRLRGLAGARHLGLHDPGQQGRLQRRGRLQAADVGGRRLGGLGVGGQPGRSRHLRRARGGAAVLLPPAFQRADALQGRGGQAPAARNITAAARRHLPRGARAYVLWRRTEGQQCGSTGGAGTRHHGRPGGAAS